MPSTVDIGGRYVGPGHPCFIIAEAGVNHDGSLDMALRLVEVAAEAGADAVKFQTFKAERILTASAPKAEYQTRTTGSEESQFEMIRRLELSREMHRAVIDHCIEKNIRFLSSPFDQESADLLDDFGVAAFKIPSGEITNLPFLAHVARKSKPMIVSTGMSDLSEVATAVRTIEEASHRDVVLLQCVSNYPADPADANLRAMNTMSAAFDLPVGFSDHINGIQVALAAVALGACVIEKHFTLDRSLPGPDHTSSVEPDELTELVRGIRTVEAALGHGRREPAPSEANTASVARKSLVAARDIPAGAVLTEELVAVKRPGTGFPPYITPYLAGRTAKVLIPEGTVLQWDMLA